MRLIFLSFRASYRKMMFNNFLFNNIYGKYIVINLGGPLKHYIAKFLIFLRIGRGISCDGDPLISKIDEKKLDVYEDYPTIYKKYYFTYYGKKVMTYTMVKKTLFTYPTERYLNIIKKGYKDCDLDKSYLKNALKA